MNFRKLILPFFLLITIGLSGQAGLNYIRQNQNFNIVGELYNEILQPDTYLQPDWIEGDILLETDEKISNIDLRYNGLTDELFWREPVSDRIIKVDKESVRGFHFYDFRGDTTVCFKRMKIKKNYESDSSLCFLQEVDFVNIRLFIYHSKSFLRRETYYLNGTKYLRDVYIEEPVYFIESGSRYYVFRKISRQSLCKSFPDKSGLIKNIFKNSASGKIKTQTEIIRFLQYLDSSFN